MIDFIRNYRLNCAVNSYINELGPCLLKRYGAAEQYTVMQIKKTAKQLKLNEGCLPYAIALFRQDESKNTISLYRINQDFLDILRAEIAGAFFDGNTGYDARDVLRLGKPKGWKGGRPNGWVTQQAFWHAIGGR